MGSLIEFIVTHTGWSAKIARLIATAALFVAALSACAGLVALYNHHVIAVHNAKVERRAKPATDSAAQERAHDTIKEAKNEQEAHDVIAAEPDQPIAPTSRALACKRLRDAGRRPPACR